MYCTVEEVWDGYLMGRISPFVFGFHCLLLSLVALYLDRQNDVACLAVASALVQRTCMVCLFAGDRRIYPLVVTV